MDGDRRPSTPRSGRPPPTHHRDRPRLAEREGWDAVTTRRLSTEIEYSQPVLYKHFASMEDIVEAVALRGLRRTRRSPGAARASPAGRRKVLSRVAHAYSGFADREPGALRRDVHPRHTIAIRSRGHPIELRAAFAELREAVASVAGGRDVDTLTEVLWARCTD